MSENSTTPNTPTTAPADTPLLKTSPVPYIIAGCLIIALFAGGLIVWSVFFPFQGAVIAPGVVKVSGERKVVQHLEGGIIDTILVDDGDWVEEGDVLIELKSSQIHSNVDLLRTRLSSRLAETARLRAQAAGRERIIWPEELVQKAELARNDANDDIAQIMATEVEIFQSRRSDMHNKIKLYRSQIKQIENQIEGARQELAGVREVIANLQADLKSKRSLLKDKYMGKSGILELERSLSEYKGRRGKLNQDIARLQQTIQERRLQIIDATHQYREEAVSRLGEVSDMVFDIREKIKPELDALQRLQVKAPISGVVLNMKVHSENSGVIKAGMPLLEIVPQNMTMVVEAQVRPQDITSVRRGQDTKVRLAAFQRKSTPPVKGRVIYVSPDLMYRESSQGEQPYYETRVEVDKNDLKAKGAYLSPGMPVSCYITTDKRTVISYLLSPLLKNVDTAMRE